ncbi:protein OSB4, chloroplastic-like isoform X2 [Chenopodium quinoa]|uniref:protein OSB4, chloroplastic-like isoform X2 n=1 Tax=Chenopodium quinoa TaxID=63459 RepID=UPI000B78BD0E|nr:protein OSB4, chloroplastic-like isoform X2 [Chenopodium quinoa]
MNLLHKTLTKTSKSTIFFPSIPPIRQHPFSLSSSYSTKLPIDDSREKKNLARPSEIPFQPKVVNRVNFVGTVTMPVKVCTSADGKSWASTVISHLRQPLFTSNSLWIPIIFEGDLAITAATHLRENDNVHIAGHLSSARLPIDLTDYPSKVQLFTLSLVLLFVPPFIHLERLLVFFVLLHCKRL